MTTIDRNKIQEPFMGRPHVVILGAGASLAAFPNGDKHGRKLPLMYNIVDVVGLRPNLQAAGINYNGENFETLYSSLVAGGQHRECVEQIERALFEYFGQMELPDEPTLYDHLVISLRDKDLIATFNWDPFLMQAMARNHRHMPSMPQVTFLHGNTAVGHCMAHQPPTLGQRGNRCGRCGQPLQESRLLYPVAQKNYNSDPFIQKSWDNLKAHLEHAYLVTVFGYGAPASDVEAVELLKLAWGDPSGRELEEIEVIDIKTDDELYETWKPFIHSHHYRTSTGFYDSLIANHPRRTCDAMWSMLMDVQFIDINPLPRNAGWSELLSWYAPIIADEASKSSSS